MTILRPLLVVFAIAAVAPIAGCSESSAPAAPTPAPTPTPAPAPAPTPAPAPAAPLVTMELLEVRPEYISGQSSAVGTVTLSGPAPEGGAVVSLQSTNRDVAKVPATMTIPAGEKTGTFRIESSTVSDEIRLNIIAQYGGVSNGASLTVGFDPLSAAFVVDRQCNLMDLGRLSCNFDGRASKGRISAFRWSIRTPRRGLYEWESNGAVTTPAGASCSFFSGLTDPGIPFRFTIQVELYVTDRTDARSNVASQFVDVYTNRACGYFQ